MCHFFTAFVMMYGEWALTEVERNEHGHEETTPDNLKQDLLAAEANVEGD